jgi:iron complex outermembrane recepter protein
MGLVVGGHAAALGVREASAQQVEPSQLADASLEELLAMRVVSAGKKSQLINETPAAIYVIRADDIRRSNAATITELLRQVPGIHVAREATGEWAISIRGFNDKHANKLLVLMDGRTLYSPVYTGVEWDVQDTMIEDVERIEIIRGPGASLWGANAVNGVINIITKDARETLGGLVTVHNGTLEHGSVAARYGGSVGETLRYRAFAKFFSRPSLPDAAGTTPPGGWDSFRQGARLDWTPTDQDHITVTGEWATSSLREEDEEITSLVVPFESVVEEHDQTRVGFVVARWNRKRANGSEFDARIFYDRTHQFDGVGFDKGEFLTTADVEFQHHLQIRKRHDLVWGGGFRQVRDKVSPAFDSWFIPSARTARTYNGFLQNEIGWFDNTLRLTAGSKFEWNSFSKAEIQPTARLLSTLGGAHTVWTAVSRAVRAPSRNEHDQYSLESIGTNDDNEIEYEMLMPSPAFQPERLTSYEAGYRFVPARRFSVDVATFYNRYDALQTIERDESHFTMGPITGIVTPLRRANHASANVLGTEATAFWTVSGALRLSGSYTHLHMRVAASPSSSDDDVTAIPSRNAARQLYARAYLDLPLRLDATAELRYVAALPGEDVPAYTDANVHISRPLRKGLRLDVSVDNLLHGRHAEWDFDGSQMVTRAIRIGLSATF